MIFHQWTTVRSQCGAVEVLMYLRLDDSTPGGGPCPPPFRSRRFTRARALFPELHASDGVMQAAGESRHPLPWRLVVLLVGGIVYSQHRRVFLGEALLSMAELSCDADGKTQSRRVCRLQNEKKHGP